MTDYAKDVLVETDWLEAHLERPGDPHRRGRREPRALRRARTSRARSASTGRPTCRTRCGASSSAPRRSASCSARTGSRNEHLIVLYGDRNNWFAAYTYWYLKYYGHERVKLLNGPREKWIAEGRPTTTDAPGHAPATFTAQPGDDADPRAARRGDGGARRRHAARRRPLAEGVLGRADRDAGLRAGGRPARRPHPRRRVGAVGAGRARGRHVQVRRASSSSSTATSRCSTATRSSPTAASASARRTRGSCCTSCSATPTSRTTTAPGRSGATSSASRSRRAS